MKHGPGNRSRPGSTSRSAPCAQRCAPPNPGAPRRDRRAEIHFMDAYGGFVAERAIERLESKVAALRTCMLLLLCVFGLLIGVALAFLFPYAA